MMRLMALPLRFTITYHCSAFLAVLLLRGGAGITAVAAAWSPSRDVALSKNIQIAMHLSNTASSTNNITATHQACHLWTDILRPIIRHGDTSMTAPMIRSGSADRRVLELCCAVYASCLVRIGQDEEAVDMYDQLLFLLDPASKEHYGDHDDAPTTTSRESSLYSLRKAQALQRLLRYDEARDSYERGITDDSIGASGAVEAATCSLRMADPKRAFEHLQRKKRSINMTTDDNSNEDKMLSTLQFLINGDRSLARLDDPSGSSPSPLYRWIRSVLLQNATSLSNQDEASSSLRQTTGASPSVSFLELLQINTSPFDDDRLFLLDDKVYLHRLLSSGSMRSSHFWPQGMVLSSSPSFPPIDLGQLQRRRKGKGSEPSLWIAKARAGYGSHGNQILTQVEAEQLINESKPRRQPKDLLLQELISPTLLVKEGQHKFSIRIYVVYFTPQEVYLSSQGLVKVASQPVHDLDKRSIKSNSTNNDPRVYMTNSGRETDMMQADLDFLKQEMEAAGLSYSMFWSQLEDIIRSVIGLYQSDSEVLSHPPLQPEYVARRESLGIPKIMGWDLVVDETGRPWLVECNRFPGLEPRDESDLTVKHEVVRDAWILASQRLGMSDITHPLDAWLRLGSYSTSNTTSSLERIV